MFDNLLSALPFNPSLIHQLSFYAKRIRKEEAVRKAGLVFIVLAFLIQFFAFISPPTLASASGSPNDLIYGGIANYTQAYNACKEDLKDNGNVGFGDVLAYYGITCAEVKAAPTVMIQSTAFNRTLFSMGVVNYNNLAGEKPVVIDNATYYERYLWAWDGNGPVSTYRALEVTTSARRHYFILYSCGNLVSIGRFPVPVVTPKPKPKPCTGVITSADFNACVTTRKTATNVTEDIANANNTTAKPNDLIRYTLYAHNKGTGVVKDYIFSDSLTNVLDYGHIAASGKGVLNTVTDNIVYPARNIGPLKTDSVVFVVRVNNPIPETLPPASDPGYDNMEMYNYFGNPITIKLQQTPVQTVETLTGSTGSPTATTLPNTGPGIGIFIASAVVVIAGFFFYRSRLLSKESIIAIKENSVGVYHG